MGDGFQFLYFIRVGSCGSWLLHFSFLLCYTPVMPNETAKSFLEKTCFPVRLAATDKKGVLAELVERLIASGALPSSFRDTALAALREREAKMSTGMQLGIAIPHAKIDGISGMVAGLALSSDGVPFDSLDGLSAQIFIITISPLDEIGTHVRFLADISQLLANDSRRLALLSAETGEAMLKALFD